MSGAVLRDSKRKKKGHASKNKTPRAVPNHFFAVQISDCQIVEAVHNVHRTILEQEPKLSSALVSPSTLHITLAVAHLSSPEDLVRANQVLEETVRVFSTSRLQTQQLDLHLAQVGHFNNKVIFASVKEESEGIEHLNHLSESLRERCQTAGITLIDGDRFTPHVTLLKLSKDPRLYRKGIKAVASHLYEKHVDCVFGRQVVESVQLLSMTDPKDEKGYYALKGEFHFGTAAAAVQEIRDEQQQRDSIKEDAVPNSPPAESYDRFNGNVGAECNSP